MIAAIYTPELKIFYPKHPSAYHIYTWMQKHRKANAFSKYLLQCGSELECQV
jgi:hypothetical protein